MKVGTPAPGLSRHEQGPFQFLLAHCRAEFDSVAFNHFFNVATLTTLPLLSSEAGNFEVLAALGGILLAITFALVAIGMRFAGRDFMLRSGT